MTKVFDVVIVGAGPAGSALGIYLARAGIDVLLLEKYEFPRDKVCGDFVSPRGLKKLAELGCGEEISARAYTPVNKSLVFLGDDQLSEGLFPHLPEHPAFGRRGAKEKRSAIRIMWHRRIEKPIGAFAQESRQCARARSRPALWAIAEAARVVAKPGNLL